VSITKKHPGLFSINDFAMYSRTTKDTLLHYDRIGLLSPVLRGKNNYRYYSSGQLAIVNVIRTYQNLGMSLSEIKYLKDNRTPEDVYAKFGEQINSIDAKISEWAQARKLLVTLRSSIRSVLDIDEQAITVQFLPSEAIVLGKQNDYSHGQTDYDALELFYKDMKENYPNIGLNFPVWGLFTQARIERGDWVWPDRYYFYNPDGNDRIPEALYAIGYMRGGYGQCGSLYQRIIDYINKNGLEICGDAYEQYPLNELSIIKPDNYLIRVMIPVSESKITETLRQV